MTYKPGVWKRKKKKKKKGSVGATCYLISHPKVGVYGVQNGLYLELFGFESFG